METVGQVLNAMIEYYAGDVRRVNHFLKVYGFAKAIGEAEGLEQETQKILEIAALTHDIGIKNSEIKYQSTDGTYQQLEGPPEARKLLENLGFQESLTDRVCWLIAHHHTYDAITEIDYQILVEADFLVNAFEAQLSGAAMQSVRDKLFRTGTGKHLLNTLYGSLMSAKPD